MSENSNNIIVLKDEKGNDAEFEFLGIVEYEKENYVVLLPVEESDEAGVVVILKIEENDDKESYISIEDEDTLLAVFNIFKDKFKDEFNFVD
ncbi:MAG: DUF1292 domain-containing protein [Clostridia bacterium]|nr:DUF1292 domain-containing protein [Clostridia bacterium]